MLPCAANLFADGTKGNGIKARLDNNLASVKVSFDNEFAFATGTPTTSCIATLSLSSTNNLNFALPSVDVC